ncbi:MAG: ComEA family DNA-binding protein [Opitutaceae bacterium]
MKTVTRFVLMIGLFAGIGAASSSRIAAETTPPAEAPAEEKLVNINAATRSELEKLPGIGRVIAERIIAGRPYQAIEDLKKIEGVGDKKYEAIKDLITVE